MNHPIFWIVAVSSIVIIVAIVQAALRDPISEDAKVQYMIDRDSH